MQKQNLELFALSSNICIIYFSVEPTTVGGLFSQSAPVTVSCSEKICVVVVDYGFIKDALISCFIGVIWRKFNIAGLSLHRR